MVSVCWELTPSSGRSRRCPCCHSRVWPWHHNPTALHIPLASPTFLPPPYTSLQQSTSEFGAKTRKPEQGAALSRPCSVPLATLLPLQQLLAASPLIAVLALSASAELAGNFLHPISLF